MSSSIEPFTGEPSRRLFEFKHATHRIFDITVDTEELRAEATASILHPAGSRHEARSPQLALVDGLVIATQLSEAYVKEAFALGATDASRIWLRRCVLKTGHTNAVDLSKLPVSTTFVRTEVDPGSRCGYISHIASQLGTMSVELSIDHPIAAIRSTMASYPDIDVALGAAETRYYGAGYRNVDIEIGDLVVDRERQSASASIGLTLPTRVQISSGMGSGYVPCVSPVEALVSIAQLAEAIVHAQDSGEAARLPNMWLRKLTIFSPKPVRMAERFPVHTRLKKTSMVTGNGKHWRTNAFGVEFPVIDGAPAMTAEYSIVAQMPRAA